MLWSGGVAMAPGSGVYCSECVVLLKAQGYGAAQAPCKPSDVGSEDGGGERR